MNKNKYVVFKQHIKKLRYKQQQQRKYNDAIFVGVMDINELIYEKGKANNLTTIIGYNIFNK